MGRLAEPDLGVVEEHLLTCFECQDRVKATDVYVAAMRSALKKRNQREENDRDVSPQSERFGEHDETLAPALKHEQTSRSIHCWFTSENVRLFPFHLG